MPADETGMTPTAGNEYFSAETWSNHLEERAKDPIFELGDYSAQSSEVESP